MLPKQVGRRNDIYPIWDLDVYNNVGSALAQGDVVCVDWTENGSDNCLISPSSLAIVSTHMKAVVLDAAGIAAGSWGRVRIQGPCYIGIQTGSAFSIGDPLCLRTAGNATDNGLGTSMTVAGGTLGSNGGSNNGYLRQTIGAALETKASSSAAQLLSVIFDGSNINGIYYSAT